MSEWKLFLAGLIAITAMFSVFGVFALWQNARDVPIGCVEYHRDFHNGIRKVGPLRLALGHTEVVCDVWGREIADVR